jgi:hypothetical protein
VIARPMIAVTTRDAPYWTSTAIRIGKCQLDRRKWWCAVSASSHRRALKSMIDAPNMDAFRVIDSRQLLRPALTGMKADLPDDVLEGYLSSYEGDRFVESAAYVRSYPNDLPSSQSSCRTSRHQCRSSTPPTTTWCRRRTLSSSMRTAEEQARHPRHRPLRAGGSRGRVRRAGEGVVGGRICRRLAAPRWLPEHDFRRTWPVVGGKVRS